MSDTNQEETSENRRWLKKTFIMATLAVATSYGLSLVGIKSNSILFGGGLVESTAPQPPSMN